jgi:hypothetical protein
MYRSEEDLTLLAELAGVLDQTVTDAGLSSGTYLVLRQLAKSGGPSQVTTLAAELGADPGEVAELAGRLADEGLVEAGGSGVRTNEAGAAKVAELESAANEAMRAYVLERPHTATVYGLVASMQSGRFTVEDLLEFLAEGATEE